MTAIAIPRPNVQLKKFKHAEFASEETQCFQAEVWLNGKPAFFVSNEGRGGCNDYRAIGGAPDARARMDAAIKQLEEYVATLPPLEFHGTSMPYSLGLFIGGMVEEILAARDLTKLKRKLADRILMEEGGKLLMTKKLDRRLMAKDFFAAFAAKHPKAVVINLLPPAEQDVILRKHV